MQYCKLNCILKLQIFKKNFFLSASLVYPGIRYDFQLLLISLTTSLYRQPEFIINFFKHFVKKYTYAIKNKDIKMNVTVKFEVQN